MSREKKPGPEAPKVPSYIVTFSDMVTLLLTFFVMLLSMADTQVEDHKFMSGKSSIQQAIADFGLSGFLVNRSSGPQFDHPKQMYRVDEGKDEPEDRSIDSQTEMLRRALMEVETRMDISPSHITGISRTFFTTELRFAPGSWQLGNDDKRILSQFWQQLQGGLLGKKPAIYVLGLAGEEPNYKQQMIISARRAQAAADALRSLQTDDTKCPVYCWGAGKGGEWTGKSGMANSSTQIMIAVLIESN